PPSLPADPPLLGIPAAPPVIPALPPVIPSAPPVVPAAPPVIPAVPPVVSVDPPPPDAPPPPSGAAPLIPPVSPDSGGAPPVLASAPPLPPLASVPPELVAGAPAPPEESAPPIAASVPPLDPPASGPFGPTSLPDGSEHPIPKRTPQKTIACVPFGNEGAVIFIASAFRMGARIRRSAMPRPSAVAANGCFVATRDDLSVVGARAVITKVISALRCVLRARTALRARTWHPPGTCRGMRWGTCPDMHESCMRR